MGFDNALNQAKDVAGQHQDQVNQGIDAAAEKGKDLAPDQVDGYVDQGADYAKGQFGSQDQQQGQ